MSGNLGRQLSYLLRRLIRERAGRHRRRTGHRHRNRQGRRASSFAAGHAAREYHVPAAGLPRLEYSPDPNGAGDPGEVVWAWIPYEDDPAQGKDRPVLLVARIGEGFLGLQMTSKDHSRGRGRDDHFGRRWLDIGSGAWDSRQRDSEVRLDRLLVLPPEGVRREGATLPRSRFDEVAKALDALHS